MTSNFLAPINYRRAWDVLAKLNQYGAYSEEGARAVLALLQSSYPAIFQKTEQKTFDRHALLIEMPGANVADPLVFVSHLDAHECDPSGKPSTGTAKTGPSKTAAGFATNAALERAHVVCLLEALDALLEDGYRPGGDLMIALSMDGLSGGEGAKSIASHLKARKVLPCFVLDFGGYVTKSAFCTYLPKDAPLALIGISEKGLLQGNVVADAGYMRKEGSRQSPLAALLRSGARLSRHTRKSALCKSSEQMLLALHKHAPWPQRWLVAKPRLTFPLLKLGWRKRAIMRQFFVSERLLTGVSSPQQTVHEPNLASLSFRQTTVPGKKLPEWKHALQERIANESLQMETPIELEHSPRSGTGGQAWDALSTAIEILYDRVVIVPCLSPYVTDGRFYAPLKGNVYRFSPFLLTGEEALAGECAITEDSLQTGVQFFRQMLSV